MLIGEGLVESEEATRALGARLGAAIDAPVIWVLTGDLGSGKTVLARGLVEGLGVTEPVRSPSFTLAVPYRGGRLPVWHVDLYRLEDAREIESLGWDDWLDDRSVVVVEWGERAAWLLGPDRLEVCIEHRGGDRRRIRITAHGDTAARHGRALCATGLFEEALT